MVENLVIVESPAKAKTIEKFLGQDFLVKSSMGHIRDLAKKSMSIDVENNYAPTYEISEDKKDIVRDLKKLAKEAKVVWLASDEDREGEAIAWHLSEILDLKKSITRRIVFHEITKEAILKAIAKPRNIDKNLVDAQQARRILDRLVGFEISPVLWKKVKPSLSAGRVQSVAVRFIVDREREIIAFRTSSAYRIVALFKVQDKAGVWYEFEAELPERLKTKDEALNFLKKCISAEFKIVDIETKPAKKSPSAPFTTSTLQQEASRKLGFSVSQTMAIAQKLYEAGKITYMRTDSVNLSDTALNAAEKMITKEWGAEYYKMRQYKTKSIGAQEAHEAIRPTYMDSASVSGTDQEQKLYDLIWKRTIASQMSDAQLEKTNITISISTCSEKLIASGEVIKFDGFLKVYTESTDDDKDDNQSKILPPVKVNDILELNNMAATERFAHHPPRYTEASLVKKLEELGIGRPSTYAPIISTVQNRGYVVKETREGNKREYFYIVLKTNKITEQSKSEITGFEKNKLFPTDIGMVVNDFLVEYFKYIVDYNFTATVEQEFDEIAEGKLDWTKMIDKFYKPFHLKVEDAMEKSERNKGERNLGIDPKTGKPVLVKIGRFGPMAQLGESNTEDKNAEKPRFASILKGQHIETITLEEALKLFELPRHIGTYENKDVSVNIGRFGPYVMHNSKFISLKKGIDDPMTLTLERAIELIDAKRESDANKTIKVFENDEDLKVLNGRWGAYIAYKKENYKIPKGKTPENLSYDDCMKLIAASGKAPSAKSKSAKTKTTTKTAATKAKTDVKTTAAKTKPPTSTKKKK